MLIFLDDSGDPGFKVAKGATKSFAVATVIFDTAEDAQATYQRIKAIRQEMKLHPAFEFHFNSMNRAFRMRFLDGVAGCGFRVRAIYVEKGCIYSQTLREQKESFYNFFIKSLLKNHGGTISKAKLRLDGRGSREVKRKLKVYLRRELGPDIISDVQFRESHRDDLIQLADMVVGSIRRAGDGDKQDAQDYLKIIQPRIENIWRFV
ncbi:MAG: DUF3800 domain-containing protein [Actinobacteria bacterium]|nr:DUF3800 domain-containing protein [Actinomycetota bacterium]